MKGADQRFNWNDEFGIPIDETPGLVKFASPVYLDVAINSNILSELYLESMYIDYKHSPTWPDRFVAFYVR